MTLTARWSALVLLLTPVGTWALGLGDIELRSALNQPLDAEIHLVSATPDALSSLRVALASQETFDRYGLDRPAYLGEIIFDVGTDSLERPIISMSSRGPMAEPFVTVLVEASWSRGRLLREYTVLLDPPVLLPMPAAAPTVQAAQAGAPDVTQPAAAINRPAATPVPAPVPVPATLMAQPVEPVQAATPSPGTYGPVRSAETLWSIAEQHRPNGVTMDQMVVALYRANPQVFDGNMNTLYLGSILRIPQLAELSKMTAAAATEEALRQAADWQTGTDTQARLRLVTPGSAANADITTGGSTAAATTEIAALEGELGTALNELSESQRLLEIRDQQLQDLQAQLAAAQDTEARLAEQIAAVTPPAAVTRVVVPPIQPSLLSRVLGWLTSPILLIGLGLLALLGTAVWYLRFRQQDTDDMAGRWEALESDLGDDTDSLEATARLREPVDTEETIDIDEQNVVVEGEEAAFEPLSQSVGSDLSVGIGSADVTLDIGSGTPTGDAASAESPRLLDPHTMTMTEVGTKLDLARAYVDMGDPDGARSILEEVLEEGDDAQQKEAQGIIDAL
ncbi:MAG: FimV/HubP family polar landmark protein [Gammaproteobacteria bacterium]